MSVRASVENTFDPSAGGLRSESNPPNVPVRVYGAWPTLAWGAISYLLSMAGAYLVGLLVAVVWSAIIGPFLMSRVELTPALLNAGVEGLLAPVNAGTGVVRAVCILAMPLLGILLLVGIVSRRALRPLEYFGHFSISPRDAFRWTPLLLVTLFGFPLYAFLSSEITAFSGELVLCRETCRFVGSAIVAGLGVTVVGPIHEELLFRGFLFRGLERSRIGGLGAVAVTSALWAAAHWDRGCVALLVLFTQGLAIGWVRYRTKSLGLGLIFHVGINVVGFVPAAIVAFHGG